MLNIIFVLINIITVSFTLSSCNKNKDKISYQDGLINLDSDKTYLYSFKDCIPLEYDNKKLVFVILYYEVEVNDRAITPIIYVDSKDLS